MAKRKSRYYIIAWFFKRKKVKHVHKNSPSLQMAACNSNIDVIGHPVRELQLQHIETMVVSDWDELFKIMAQNKVAYEINLSDFVVDTNKTQFEKELIRRAAEHMDLLIFIQHLTYFK